MTLEEAKQKADAAGKRLSDWDDAKYPKHANPSGRAIQVWLRGRYPLEIDSREATRTLVRVRQENGIFEPLHA